MAGRLNELRGGIAVPYGRETERVKRAVAAPYGRETERVKGR
jgi:hypothetical protein